MRIENFWDYVAVGGPDECWPWQRGVSPNGYGRLMNDDVPREARKPLYAHRVAYELVHGPIPPDVRVRQRCRFLLCCNPAHLLPVGSSLGNTGAAMRAAHRNGEHATAVDGCKRCVPQPPPPRPPSAPRPARVPGPNTDRYVARNIAFVDAVNAETVCAHCGTQPIEWHNSEHVEQGRERYRINSMVGRHYSIAAIQAEMARCTPLCRRCHMIEDGRLERFRTGHRLVSICYQD